MEHILSRLMMEAEGGGLQRQAMKDILSAKENLSSDDEVRLNTGLVELCDLLNMATPVTIGSIRPSVFVPLVVNCMKKDNIDIVILAARALTYMVDAIPSTVLALVSEGGIDVLLQHFQEVRDIELSEQCLTCVEKLTQNTACATTVLQSMGVPALLAYVDFFSTASQRKAWTSVAAMCRRVNESNFECVERSLQDICARIGHDDAKISEKAISCLHRIISGVSNDPKLVARAFGNSCAPLMDVLSRPDSSETTFTTALSLIATAITYSTEAARRTMESGIVEYMFTLIAGSSGQQHRQPLSDLEIAEDGVSRLPGEREPSAQRETMEAASQRDKRLSVEQTKTLCLAITALLPKLNKGYLVHGDQLHKLIAEGHDGLVGRTRTSPSDVDESIREDDDEDEGEENEEEDEDEEEGFTREEILARIAEVCIPLEKNEKHRGCRLMHVCDGCGKPCGPTNWFRCNKCRDYDLCGMCLLSNWDTHKRDGETHSFCDMFELLPKTTELAPTKGDRENANVNLVVEREKLYETNPHLLALILNGIPTVVTLFNESETYIVRNQCLAFMDRAVVLATSQQLADIRGLSEAALCEMIVTALVDSNLLLNVHVMYLCRMLLEKLPSVYLPCFVHEGVANSLVRIREQNKTFVQSNEEEQPSTEELVSAERLNSISGWRGLLATEAEGMLSMFTSLSDDTRITQLKEIDQLLREGKLQEAFNSFRVALLDDTTAFELSATDVLHTLVETLKSVNDVQVVVALLIALAKQTPNTAPVLTRFVRLLQTALSHLDQFQLPTFGTVNTIHTQIPLRLIPHVASGPTKTKVSTPASKGNSSKRVTSAVASSPSSVPAREGTTRRPAGSLATRPSTLAGRSRKDQSTPQGVTGASGGRGSLENREVRVSVEPLTNLEALMVFVGSNVLSGGSESGSGSVNGSNRRRTDEDEVEEVLPELANEVDSEGPPRRKKTAQEKPARTVYMRCGKYVLPPSLTILQLLQRYHTPSPSSSRKRKTHSKGGSASLRLLALLEGMQTHVGDMITLHYSVEPFGPEYVPVPAVVDNTFSAPSQPLSVKLPSKEMTSSGVSEVMRALHNEYPFSNQFLSAAQKDILTMLGTLYAALRNWSTLMSLSPIGFATQGGLDTDTFTPSTSLAEFIHGKLNNKAMRHCSNLLLAGQHMTIWAANLALDCNFLFSSTTRKYLFDVGFCGSIRSLVQMQENMERYGVRDALNADHQFVRSFRLHREKKRVWRNKALACAMEIMNKGRVSGSVVLEFEYYDEKGSGSGPTMEFYTLVSDELRETKLRLWRRTDETPDDKYYRPRVGVYPRPLLPTSPEIKNMEPYFFFLGRLIARALLDKRILSISLSPVLLKMLRGDTCGVYDLADVSESLGASVLAVAEAVRRGDGAVQVPGSAVKCAIEDLGLDFTLPGDEFVELVEGGASVPVTRLNAMEYCDAVTEFVLRRGVERFVRALRTGFHDYLPLYALRILSVAELAEVLNGHPGRVTVEELDANCQADHGYTLGCRHVRQLFEIIASLTAEEQSNFFHFLTGSAHLPAGGLASLRPKFTIVRKTSSDPNVREQDQLPSAMTCQNYLKLPAYDTKEQMEEKLRMAIKEGCGAFLLT